VVISTKIKWTPENIDKAYDELEKELEQKGELKEHVPKSIFEKKYSGAVRAIREGRYKPNIKSYVEYLKFRGKYRGEIHRVVTHKEDIVKDIMGDLNLNDPTIQFCRTMIDNFCERGYFHCRFTPNPGELDKIEQTFKFLGVDYSLQYYNGKVDLTISMVSDKIKSLFKKNSGKIFD
jgi:hypothetical protein